MSDLQYPAYSVLALLSAVIVLIPLPWHLEAWNSGTCLYMIWTSLACLNFGINTIVWHNNALNPTPVWCDISSRIIVAVSVAIPCASLCINRRLYRIASIQAVGVTRAEKRRAIFIDLSICIGIPILQLVMEYIVSGHRFDIYEDIGCYPFIYNTPVAYPLSVVWPLVIGLVSAVYCALSIRQFLIRRAEFNKFLSSNTSLTANRYFRLMALATTELMCSTPISAYGMYLNLSGSNVRPWISWADTHYGFSRVDQYPAVIWRSDKQNIIAFELTLWLPIFCAVVFFAFFGFALEARNNYIKAWSIVVKQCSKQIPFQKRGAVRKSRDESLPTYVPRVSSYPYQNTPSSITFSFLDEKCADVDLPTPSVEDAAHHTTQLHTSPSRSDMDDINTSTGVC
ncbi:STE3-like pheromone receptor B mating type [Gelatoporia subvermispora B]|uniref:STE3-like pheromone receptor B mating type n=1 Tax=Ceriporiopsis subvermispora (strain B) TaxID=914234 RepID=M2R8W6_CERS8|nr:STE3-like pheromone receptor B mating type [Gelatoporia subvermispora B]